MRLRARVSNAFGGIVKPRDLNTMPSNQDSHSRRTSITSHAVIWPIHSALSGTKPCLSPCALPFHRQRSAGMAISKGLGTVHAQPSCIPQGQPFNVALIDCDEGFR